jgi:cytochrome c-type biogenesis protein CcmH
MKKSIIIALLAVLFVLLLAVGMAQAQEATPSGPSADEINAIAKDLYCPVCENIPLDVCGTQACAQWRALIGEKLAAGWTEEQIKAYFVEQYGDRVLAEPPRRGLNWLVYILPPVAMLIGLYILFKAIKSWRSSATDVLPETSTDLSDIDEEYIARLEEELRKRE